MKVSEFIKIYDAKNIQEVYIYQWNSKREAVNNIPYAPNMEYVILLSDSFNYELPEINEFITNVYELTPSECDYIDDLSSYDNIEELEEKAMHEEKTILYIVLSYGKKFKNDFE